MKKTLFILAVLLVSLFFYSGILIQEDTLPFSREFFSVETSPEGRFAFNLKGRETPSQKEKDPQESFPNSKNLDALYQLKLDRGIRNVPTLTFFLIREARASRKAGHWDQAIAWTTYAVQFSPDLPQPYFARAWTRWRSNPLQFYRPLHDLWKGVLSRFHYFPEALHVFYNLFTLLGNALLMVFLVFGIVLLFKYLPLYLYEIRKTLHQEAARLILSSLKIFLLLIPFFFRLDILWALFYYAVLLWGFVSPRERRFLIFFLVVLAYVPYFLRAASSFLDQPASDILQDLHQANYEDWDRGTEQRLMAWISRHPNDREVLFTLGLLSKRQGLYPQAEEQYRRLIQMTPSFSEAFSNLGNIHFARRQTDQAIASYQQAIDLNPRQAAYHYNLYRAYAQETFLSGKIDRSFQKARQLDPGLVDFYVSIDQPPHPNRLVIDQVLSPLGFWSRFWGQFIGAEGILFRLFKTWFERIPSRLPFLSPLFFLALLLLMSKATQNKRYVTKCPLCGTPTYRFYLGEKEKEYICFNCYRITIQKEKFSPRVSEKKIQQIRQFKQTHHLIGNALNYLFVGFHDLWEERSLKGLFFLFIFFVLLLKIVYWDGMIPPLRVSFSRFLWEGPLWGGFFALFYFLAVRKRIGSLPEPESPDGKDNLP